MRSGINRGFTWLRKVLQVTEETESPSTLGELVRPTMDVFGWERLAPALIGAGPRTEAFEAAATVATVLGSVVPVGIMRYIIRASCSTTDPAGIILTMVVRSGGVDIGIAGGRFQIFGQPARLPLERPVLLAPGERLACTSTPAPAAATALFIRYNFVDLDFGEYLPAI